MDPRHTGEMLKHLEKQNELLKDSYKSMSYELHKLQGGDGNVSDNGKSGHSTALVNATSSEQ
ncbi:hypothetical protein HS088_TW01G00757 [Tripterygium wilfordii]|uniref:Uncharacterized protein n=1 Tax=Tripterygium wilfordii TaxID=458696 RepID=A0A7J7E2R7_TRIWF|nr:hypothetical protein HS088_TW01G00757 [Tripterygium wilfordii]